MKNWGEVIVVENGDWRAYDWHWAGRRILDMLIGGPDLAHRHIQTFWRSDDRDFDWIAPESSGAVIDLDRHRLLFFGDELIDGPPHRRALMAVLADVWSGFEVVWAYGGTRELAAYVGHDCPPALDGEPTAVVTSDRYSPCQLVSVVARDGAVRLWPLVDYHHPEAYGPAFLDALPGRGRRKVALKAIPARGVHVDPSSKTVGVWWTADGSAVLDRLAEIWHGWNFEFWEDRYEQQVARCVDGLRIPPLNWRAVVDEAEQSLRQRIFGCGWDSPASDALELAERLRRIAPGFPVPDDAVLAGLVRPNADEWGRFAAACTALRFAEAA
ncbi:hypothetical protein JDV09_14735 [Mycobacterium sp. Y57]|uniref:hypothetical protein n=1 Tax=Mycolicibacterium xanthum TaxID=2796469 RepID=UPI001C85C6D9|nr:hypothetical protein [Mycolicibacterium xanthum]MBX7433359.1 hypothetical protein [Mycolicibacterium xanthum]